MMSSPLSAEAMATIVRQYFAATRSADKVAGMVACFAPDTVSYDPVGSPALQGTEAMRQLFEGWIALFAEVQLQEEFLSVNGSEVAVKWWGEGQGYNGRAVTFEGIDIFEIGESGKIQSLRAYWNPAVVLAALTAP